jgi:hydrophobic/amphiphilic exporter-1 (mainly G- bacteria), HAE1 family
MKPMKIAELSIKQPVFITMVILAVLVLGLVSYTRLGVDMMPDISLPVVAVTVANPGVGPEEIETQITKPIEDAVSAINGLKRVTSTSSEGVAVIVAEFNLEKDAQLASTEVREKIAAIRNTLPRESLEPVIDKVDFSAVPVVTYYITAKIRGLSLVDVRTVVDEKLKPQIERVNGVGKVSILGGLEREIQIGVDPDKLNALGLSITQVGQAIRTENINIPAGRVTQTNFDFLIRTNAEFKRVDELNRIIVANPGGSPVTLQEVAEVTDGYKTRTAISRINGQECVSVVVQKQSGTNTVKTARAVKKAMVRIEKNYPDLSVVLGTDESVFIEDARNDVVNSLIEGAFLAGLVVLLSFGDLRNTLVTIAGLPVCVIGSFAVMQAFGFSLNIITLLALSLSIGLLIDDAIVVRENIFRHMEKFGKPPRIAAGEGTSEVALAVTATTLTIVAVFMPVAFATGIAGKFFRQFGIVVTGAVLISLFEAFTFAPMLSAVFFKETKRKKEKTLTQRFNILTNRFYDGVAARYRPILSWSLRHRGRIVLMTAGVFIFSIFLMVLLGTGGNPRGNRPEFNIVIQFASGQSLEESSRVVAQIEDLLRKQEEVGNVISIIGTDQGASDEAALNVKLKRTGIAKAYQDKLRPLLAGIPGALITFQDATSLGGAAASALKQQPIQINLKSTDLKSLNLAADRVKGVLSGIPGLVDVNTDYRSPKPEIQIRIDRDRAARLGVNTGSVAQTLRSLVEGDVVSRFRTGEKQVDIRVRESENVRNDLERLVHAIIPTSRGGAITLDQVARLEVVNGPAQIKRSERNRQIVVAANAIKGTAFNEIKAAIQKKLEALNLPGGIAVEFGGQVEENAEQFATLFLSLLLGVVFVYMILASQFGSFVQPFAIMLALPLAIIGAVLGLLVANRMFDTVAFIGLIMLMGLVTKNSILLVDFVNIARRNGMERTEAILSAGTVRLRPILMTTLAMILSMIPVAFGVGTSADFRAPIGITIIGGLISSTILTLVIVPVAYSIIDDWARKFSRKK